jgi:hypothetical protein
MAYIHYTSCQSPLVEPDGARPLGVERSNTTALSGRENSSVDNKLLSVREYKASQTVGLYRSKTQITPVRITPNATDPAGGQGRGAMRRLSTIGGITSPISPQGSSFLSYTNTFLMNMSRHRRNLCRIHQQGNVTDRTTVHFGVPMASSQCPQSVYFSRCSKHSWPRPTKYQKCYGTKEESKSSG